MSDYDEIKSYAKYMYKRNLKKYNGILSDTDLLNDAYAKGFETIDEAKKIIRNEALNEKRRLIGQIQQRHIMSNAGYVKVCNICHHPKPATEFRLIVDKTGYTYYHSYCNDCETARTTSEAYKQKKRENYANSPTAKIKNRERQRRWAARQKLLKQSA